MSQIPTDDEGAEDCATVQKAFEQVQEYMPRHPDLADAGAISYAALQRAVDAVKRADNPLKSLFMSEAHARDMFGDSIPDYVVILPDTLPDAPDQLVD